jgi:hypothetical protein
MKRKRRADRPSCTLVPCFFISSLRGCVIDLAPSLDCLLGFAAVMSSLGYMLSSELVVHLQFSGSHVLCDWRWWSASATCSPVSYWFTFSSMASFSLVDLVLFSIKKFYTRYVSCGMCDVAMWCFISCFGTIVVKDCLVASLKFKVAAMSFVSIVWYLVVCCVVFFQVKVRMVQPVAG